MPFDSFLAFVAAARDYLIVFCAVAALDFVWALYTVAVTEKRHWCAGLHAGIIIALSGAAAIGYTQNHWLLIPAALGAFCGTMLAVKIS